MALSVHRGRDLKAKLTAELAKKDLIQTGSLTSVEDGQLINPDAWLQDFQKEHDAADKKIGELKRIEVSSFAWTRRVEVATLWLASVGMVLLVGLAWLNF